MRVPLLSTSRPEPDALPIVPPDAAPGKNMTWAELIRRVFEVDVLECPDCGGPMRILAAIQTPKAIRDILNHLGLPSRPPPIAPVRRSWADSREFDSQDLPEDPGA